jgi:gluconolactonase
MYLKRRGVLALASTAAVAGAVGCALADWHPTRRYPDPGVEILDPAFAKYRFVSWSVWRPAFWSDPSGHGISSSNHH